MSNPVVRFFASKRFAHVLGSVGRLMITSGSVILLLVAYQLWGTNLETNRSQREIKADFASTLDQAVESATIPGDDPVVDTTGPTPVSATNGTTTTTVPATTTTTTAPAVPNTEPVVTAPPIAPPAEGEAVGRISIPSIGLTNFYFVEGTGVAQLKRGAAHYPTTPLPGQAGNAAIAGHRTTYGAPFHNIDKVRPGDEIIVETQQGRFRYEARELTIVKPRDTFVLENKGDNRLTLTACHPKFSARERIILVAALVGEPVAPIPGQAEAAAEVAESSRASGASSEVLDEFADEPVVRFPGAWWGIACMGLWFLVRLTAWLAHRNRWFPRAIPYIIGTPVCLLFLYFFFEAFSYEAFARSINLSI